MILQMCLGRGTLRADDVQKLVDAPMTPGIVALLARHVPDPRAVERLKGGLSSTTASVRAVAARAAAVVGLGTFVAELREALARETDAGAAREEIRALCTIAGPPADAEALVAAKRFAPRLDRAYAGTIARLRGAQALTVYFSALRELDLSQYDREVFFRLAVNRDGPDLLSAAGSLALSRGASNDWSAVLRVASERKVALNEGILVAGLRGEDAIVRGEAAWYLAKAQQGKPLALSSQIREAVSSEAAPPADPELRFGLEMLRRVLGSAPKEDEGWISCLENNPECHLDSDFNESPLISLLTEREADAVMRRNKRDRSEHGSRMIPESKRTPDLQATPVAGSPPSATSPVRLRMVTGLPQGMVSDLLAVSGCKSAWSSSIYPVAEIDFWAHGLPKQVRVSPVHVKKCQATADAIFLMTSEPDDGRQPEKSGVYYLALLDADVLKCQEVNLPEDVKTAGEVRMVRGKVVAPILVSRIEPIYREDSRRKGHQGVSVYEAIISPNGCVGDLNVIQSSHPDLDITGMAAIAHWRYTPATIDGRPVRVYLTVTVTFSLHK
ncbi:MAG: energy transducer TonB [Acidobacteriota bacterium]